MHALSAVIYEEITGSPALRGNLCSANRLQIGQILHSNAHLLDKKLFFFRQCSNERMNVQQKKNV